MQPRYLEIMDTTLRDGEQTSGVSFSASEKLALAQMLLTEVKVDRVEVASARVSAGELEAVQQITRWAQSVGMLDRVEVLTFVDGQASLDWMRASGARVMNLLTKGSLNHLTHQLKKTPEQHFADIQLVIDEAQQAGFIVNVYLEDWSNGMRNSPAYVLQYLDFLQTQPISRVLLPDTLGILTPAESYGFISQLVNRYPSLHFDFHAHNDYDLGVANVMEGIRAGAHGIHLTVNGLGERAGNAPLASTLAVIRDFMPDIRMGIVEKSLYQVSKIVETFSGLRIPDNKPVVGDNVFTQTAGIHADGDKKNNLYFNALLPERFGRKRSYALGKTSGKANIENNLRELGIQLPDDELKKVTQRVIELGDLKEVVTREDLPYVIADVLGQSAGPARVEVLNYALHKARGLKPSATLQVRIDADQFEESAQGDGQYDAFMNALRAIYTRRHMTLPQLTDYVVRIPSGGRTDALCETIITWKLANREFKTRGLDSDQTVSAIKATQRMLNMLD